MERKHLLPDWVKIYIEKGKSIKVRNNKYYLFEEKCIYDKTRKNKNYTLSTYLGRITKESGFIKTKKQKTIEPETYSSKIYGHYAVFSKYCSDILERLRLEFGEYGNLIFTIASLRAIEKTPYYDISDAYNGSYFSIFDKNLPMSQTQLSEFLIDLSKHKDKFKKYMKEDIKEDDTLIYDGTNLLCGSVNISYSAAGYNHGHSNYKTQVNVLYAYSNTKRKLVYYKLFEGSVPDSKSLTDIMNEANIKKGIAIIDNGFNSEDTIIVDPIVWTVSNKIRYLLS